MMKLATNVTDISAWIGTWPFDLNGTITPDRLADRLSHAGISEALVSPLGAVLAPDVMPANRQLLAECAENPDRPVRFHPVPVINPALPTWKADLATLAAGHGDTCPAIRLIPTWHHWAGHPDAAAVLRAIHDTGMTPIIQARMLDERAMPPSAAPQEFDANALASILGAVPEVPVVVAGLYRTELPAIAGLDHVAVDLSFLESEDTLATILGILPPERILPGTHAPMHEPLCGIAKLPALGPNADTATRIATKSARSWFAIP